MTPLYKKIRLQFTKTNRAAKEPTKTEVDQSPDVNKVHRAALPAVPGKNGANRPP